MKKVSAFFISIFLVLGLSTTISAQQRDPNLYDFTDERNQLLFTCKDDFCEYDDPDSDIKGVPLLRDWAIEETVYYASPAQYEEGTHAPDPMITYVDTKSGLWIRQNPVRVTGDGEWLRCEDFSYTIDQTRHDEWLCLLQAKVPAKSHAEAKQMIKLIKNWRIHHIEKIREAAKKEKQQLAKKGLKRYSGNYFSVLYPKDFTAKPAMKEEKGTKKSNTDEATFISPDGAIEFFVYSPLWSGKPLNYLDKWQNETLLDQDGKKDFKENAYRNYVLTSWKTFKANDASYQRSYVAQRGCHDDGQSSFNDCTTKVFGIKYKNKKAYEHYKPAYLAFKKSLEQYAD